MGDAGPIRFSLDSVDWDQAGGEMPHAEEDLRGQLPLTIERPRTLPGPDRPDYVAGTLVDRPVIDEVLDFGKCDYIGQGNLTDVTATRT